MGCTLAPPGEYDWTVQRNAALRQITLTTCLFFCIAFYIYVMGRDRDFKFVTHIASLNLQMTNSPKKGVVIVMWPIVNFCKLYHIFKFHMGGLDPHGSLAPHESTSRTTSAVFARLAVMTDRPKGKGICRVLIMNYSSLGAQVWHKGPHRFTCHPHVCLQVEWNFNPQPQSITTLLAGIYFPSQWG